MKKTFFKTIALSLVFLVAYTYATAQKLDLKWKSDTLLRVPESVLFDAGKNILYVSCIEGKPDQKDGKGYIAKVSPTGKIETLQWVNGLDAPKGLGLYKNNLYVTDVSRIVVIDITTGKITNKIEVEGAVFLNDITVDKNGVVYASDSRINKIYTLKNNKVELYFETPEFKGVNGLLSIPTGLYVVDFGTGVNYKLGADKKLTKYGETSPGADGIVSVGKDEYLVSNWHGEVYFVNAQGQSQKLLDTKDQKISAADIEYDPKTKTLYIPNFFANTVTAYTFSK